MVTTRRSEKIEILSSSGNSAVDLLERSGINVEIPKSAESLADARERMRRNLNKIMGYDKFPEGTLVKEKEEEKKETDVSLQSSLDSDLKPSLTTLQFQDEEIKPINNLFENEAKKSNSKLKIIAAIVAVAVTVMLTFIVINASLISNLNAVNAAKYQVLTSKIEEYNSINAEIDSISSNDYISNIAETDLGMIKAK